MIKDCLVSGETKVVGLIGYPVEHSFSPVMHNAAFQHLHLNYVYVPFPVASNSTLTQAVRGLFSAGAAGLNVTVPYKEQVISCLDNLDGYARSVGAVNTIVREQDKLVGYNTDGKGFIQSLRSEGVEVMGRNILLLGAGGAAKAVAFALGQAGVSKLYIANRTVERAEQLAAQLLGSTQTIGIELSERALGTVVDQCSIIVNTTSIGMYPRVEGIPFPALMLTSNHIVADLVYNPVETRLLSAARKQGCKTISGLGMLAYQGAASFQLWTGQTAPVEIMQKVIAKMI